MGNESSSLPVDLPEEFITELLDRRQQQKKEGGKEEEEDDAALTYEEKLVQKIVAEIKDRPDHQRQRPLQKIIEEEINGRNRSPRGRRNKSNTKISQSSTIDPTTAASSLEGRGGGPKFSRSVTADEVLLCSSSPTAGRSRRCGKERVQPPQTMSRSLTTDSRIEKSRPPPQTMSRSLTTDSRIEIGHKLSNINGDAITREELEEEDDGEVLNDDPQKVIRLLERYSVVDEDLADNFLKSLRRKKKPTAAVADGQQKDNDDDDQ